MRDLPDGIKLPEPLTKIRRGGEPREQFDVCLRTVTPILGGAARTRTSDKIDVIRTPTIRGHLRFWWRALHAHCFTRRPADLYEEEARVWGRAGDDGGSSGRSPVELRVERIKDSGIDSCPPGGEGAYALWPARGNSRKGIPTAPRRLPGLEFRLTVSAPSGDLAQVRDAVRLWILFGGYGSRTRRGLGALTVCDAPDEWLPSGIDKEELLSSLNTLIESSSGSIFPTLARGTSSSVPMLAGASMLVAFPLQCDDGTAAWLAALDRLRDFRQGEDETGKPARDRHRGRSFWPEADVVRWLVGKPGPGHAHAPRSVHAPSSADPPLWPRAGFGLPIEIQFAPRDKDNSPCDRRDSVEPRPVQLLWRDGSAKERDRLASPLIVKPLPVHGGFLPMALWLNRAAPDGKVIAKQGSGRSRVTVRSSGAPFSRPFNAPLFTSVTPALAKSSLRDAFCAWLVKHRWTKVS